ncbi:MAG: Uma2 family endonuclease [Cyclobacteriaceae bacterium]|jgi:Uma2 family endonuclease|nr:Uma2 family endonuclease [Cyclobacteriaceae bacterium]
MTTKIIDSPPRTAMEVFEMLPEGTLAEVIEGQFFISPAPSFQHQDTLLEIASQLRTLIRAHGHRVIVAPFDVYLDKNENVVQPDICVILKSNRGILGQSFKGIPDLIVEISSHSNSEPDLTLKRKLYQKVGVQEYWIVNPETKEVIGYQQKEGVFGKKTSSIATIQSFLLDVIITF